MNQALTRIPSGDVSTPLGVNEIVAQVTLIQNVMSAVMRDKEHYGTIPGCGDKPTLLQPGAQKLLMTFRLAPEYEIQERDMGQGHREYRVQVTLKSIQSGSFVGQGVGCCSTMEGKFRFRVAPKKATDRPVPKSYWDTWKTDPKKAQELLGGAGFSKVKTDGGWFIAEGSNDKVEHDNPADYYNTVLKMAKKRALVDATLTATAASDIFTQDIEDMPEVIPNSEPATAGPAPAPRAAAPAPKPAQAPKAAPTPVQTPNPANPEGYTFAEDFWLVICPIPHKGQKRDEYLKNPDTIKSMFQALKGGDSDSGHRLWGFVRNYEPKPWQGRDGAMRQPNASDVNWRKALDQFADWSEKKGEGEPNFESQPPEEDSVPF